MYKEIITKFQGLNVRDIYKDVVRTHPSIAQRFNKFYEFSDLGGRTRGHLLEFAVYHFMDQGALFNVMQKGSDFIDEDGNFDLKCITLKDNLSLSGDTPIGAFNEKQYDDANVIKKLKRLIIPVIDRKLEIIDVREFNINMINDELKNDWNVIYNHIMNNKEGNCNGNHCKYLRAKKRGSKYYIMFTQNKNLNLLKTSKSIATNKNKITNKRIYISNIKKKFINVPVYLDFYKEFERIGIKGIYDKYILKNDINFGN
jgi:hypothetical protein